MEQGQQLVMPGHASRVARNWCRNWRRAFCGLLLTVVLVGGADQLVRAESSAKPPSTNIPAVAPTPAAAYREPTTGMEFVAVPAGCFRMGDTYGDGQGDEKPVHEVCLDGFLMGRFEVTNAQYRKFRPQHSSGTYEGNVLDGDNQPVVNVSWYDAVAFARWLSDRSGRTIRLPSEAEREYASRGGTSGRNYWGDDPLASCRYANGADLSAKSQWPDWAVTDCNDGYKVSAPVGSFLPNAYGLYDMMGNVWEWTADWYDEGYYALSPRLNPRGPAQGTLKIPNGGGWGNASECVRVADRNGFPPGFSILFLGFRLVIAP